MKNQNNQTLDLDGQVGGSFTLGDGNNDAVTANNSSDLSITLGNGNNDSVTANSVNDDITLGNGNNDTVTANGTADKDHITLGDGKNDTVTINGSGNRISLGDGNNDTATVLGGTIHRPNSISLGNGNNDKVFSGGEDTVIVGNGNDTVHVGTNDTVQVGTGQDTLAFDWNPLSTVTPLNQGPDQSKPGGIGAVTITGFDTSKDVIVLQKALATDFNHLNFQDVSGNTVVTIQGDASDAITLVGVRASDLHASDFQFV